MFGGGIDFGRLQQQVRDMQKKLAELQNDLKERIVEGSAGGGMVKVKANGAQQIVDVSIEPEVMDDREMLQDLVVSATNDALQKSKELRDKEMAKITGLGAGGLGGLLGL